MHSLITRIFVILLGLVIVNGARTGNKRIVGGSPVSIDKVPYTVQITDNYNLFLCGGTIVAPNFIVTAAHCLDGMAPRILRIYAGATFLEQQNVVERGVANFTIHPDYVVKTLHLDVAVIKLNEDLPFGPTIKPIEMCTTPVEAGVGIQVSGWGKTYETSEIPSKELRTVRVPVLSWEGCVKQHEGIESELTSSMFCASEAGTKDACTGDSGGPAVLKGELCGIVSWGVGCGEEDYPGIYTSIPEVRNYIDYAMRTL